MSRAVPYTANAADNAVAGSCEAKKTRPTTEARAPKTAKSYHSAALPTHAAASVDFDMLREGAGCRAAEADMGRAYWRATP